ncbi:MAG: Ig-like domain-containing protein [Gemmatimonadota bacterium]|nr:Ig-like domain-containing protein [Gemmatimonadota bacterium]
MHRNEKLVGCVLGVLATLTPVQLLGQRIADLQVIPERVTLALGERKEVLAVAYGSGGDVLTRVSFNWSESDRATVRVEIDAAAPPGVANLVGTGPGSATVTVQVGSLRRTLQVTVTGGQARGPQGTGVASVLRIEPMQLALFPLEDRQLRPVFLKADGTLAAFSPVTWRSFRPDVADVDQTGKVVGLSPGLGAIEATAQNGLQARIQVQVALAPWTFADPVIALSPLRSDTVDIVVPTQGNRRVENRWFTWGSTDPNVVTVSPLGVVTAMSAGSAEIGASGFGQDLRIPARVHRELAGLNVRPTRRDTVIVPLGGTQRFQALPVAADETLVLDAPVTWTVGDTTVLGFSLRDSLASGKAIGTATLTARAAGDWESVWNVRVVAAGLALDRNRVGMSPNDRVTLTASFADSQGNALARATGVTWTSSNTSVARVSPEGTITPISYGRTDVVASTPWNVADTAAVFVQGELVVTSTRAGTADIFAFDRATPTQFNAVTSGPGDDIGPAYAPDGSRLAYASNVDGNFEIYVVDADGANPTRITETAVNETEPAWTPDGKKIVYQSDADGTPQIWVMNVDGTGQRPLTSGAANLEPTVSRDGGTIAFTSIRDSDYEIYLMDLDGANQRNFTRGPGTHQRAPAWLGGDTVLYLQEERVGRTATFVVVKQSLDGQTQALTDATLVVTDFAVAPTGDLLAVTVESKGSRGRVARRLYLLPLGGGEAVEVPRQAEQDQLVRPAFRW